ncbi:MAG: GIY-YIG nuclease family protein [Deltaproteobacteria bacterium]|nr:GIY-YIG nuclease family protein [Deltaproteobacteria bacterium]
MIFRPPIPSNHLLSKETMSEWYVYMVRCSDESLYTGITKDVERRIEEHNGGGLSGARYTRARRPVRLVCREIMNSRSEAAKREFEIKRLSKEEKEALVMRSNQ